MNYYQLNFFKKILLISLSLLQNPYKIKLYFNEYIKNKFSKINVNNLIISYPKSGRTWLYEILKLYAFKLDGQRNDNYQTTVKINNSVIKFDHDCSDWVPYQTKF